MAAAHLALINQVWTPEGARERLVVVPAQYRSTEIRWGTERLFARMDYTVYYSPSTGLHPAQRLAGAEQASRRRRRPGTRSKSPIFLTWRVAVVVTTGDGHWQTVKLRRVRYDDNPNLRFGQLPHHAGIEWFVQAVDTAGNVAVDDNKGSYFGAAYRQWFPIVYRWL